MNSCDGWEQLLRWYQSNVHLRPSWIINIHLKVFPFSFFKVTALSPMPSTWASLAHHRVPLVLSAPVDNIWLSDLWHGTHGTSSGTNCCCVCAGANLATATHTRVSLLTCMLSSVTPHVHHDAGPSLRSRAPEPSDPTDGALAALASIPHLPMHFKPCTLEFPNSLGY